MSDSILQTKKECYVCGRQTNLERHHIYSGIGNRKWSEKYGCWVWLCHSCHTGDRGAQYEKELNLKLKREAQAAFEEEHTRGEFLKIFGRNYL